MDGRLAALFWAAAALNSYDHGVVLEEVEAPPRWQMSLGQTYLNEDAQSHELRLSRNLGVRYGVLEPVVEIAASSKGAGWVGLGLQHRTGLFSIEGAYTQLHFVPGYYHHGDDADIGGVLEFRSGVEMGYEFDNGASIALGYDHRSNADLGPINPGLESVYLAFGMRF